MDIELIYVLKDLENKARLADCLGKDAKYLGVSRSGKYYKKLINKIKKDYIRRMKRNMDYYGSKYRCEHDECPYRDCNYHYKSTGKYSHVDPDKIRIGLPKNEEEASWCMSCLDI